MPQAIPLPASPGDLLIQRGGAFVPAGLVLFGAYLFTATQTFDTGSGPLPSLAGSPQITLSAADGVAGFQRSQTFANSYSIQGVRAGNTRAAPAATEAGAEILAISSAGHDGSTFTGAKAIFRLVADGLWSGANNGNYFEWLGTTNGSTTRSSWMFLQGGNLGIGVTPTASQGRVQSIESGLNPSSNVNAAFVGRGSWGGGYFLVDGAGSAGLWASGTGATLNISSGGTTSGFGSSAGQLQLNGGNLGISVAPSAGNGLLQLLTGTTKVNGIAYGDTFQFRYTSGGLDTTGPAATDIVNRVSRSTGEACVFAAIASTALIGAQSNHPLTFITNNSGRLTIAANGLTATWFDGISFSFGSTTGTKFGTNVAEKLSFWNATPIVQPNGYGTPTGAALLINFPGATATLAQTSGAVADLITKLKAMGLIGA